MRNGVVIGCVGVVAAAAVAVAVYVQPAAPAPSQAQVPVAPKHFARSQPVAVPKAPRVARPVESPATSTGGLPAAYRILLTRSIFAPNHTAGAGVKSPDSNLTLRGIVQWEHGYYAYVENATSGEARQVHIGDTIGHKKVTNIDLHSVEFVEGKRAMRIAVGQPFDPLSSAANGSALATVRPQAD
jgi:hypothetical protein